MSKQPSSKIRNCVFRFRCTQSWEALTETENPGERYCGDCERHVHYCGDEAALVEAIRANYCVAIPSELCDESAEDEVSLIVGMIGPPEYPFDDGDEVPER